MMSTLHPAVGTGKQSSATNSVGRVLRKARQEGKGGRHGRAHYGSTGGCATANKLTMKKSLTSTASGCEPLHF
jgi:hypothetical protein